MWGRHLSHMTRGGIAAGLIYLLPVTGAHAADLGELHRMFGVGLGEPADPPGHLRSIVTRAPCACPDFCTADLPVLGSQGAMSVRWQFRGGICRADLMTVESNPLL